MTVDLQKNWDRMHGHTANLLADCEHLIPLYYKLFARKKDDITLDAQNTILGLYRAPGSKDRHHDFEGGLVAHMLEMWEIYTWLVPMFKNMGFTPFSSSVIWRGIIHHDLNKIHRYRLLQSTPWEVDYFANDMENKLLGAAQKSLNILMENGLGLDVILHNALLTAEGGYTKNHPGSETSAAKLLYLLDDMSANVVDRMRSGRFWDSKRGGMDVSTVK